MIRVRSFWGFGGETQMVVSTSPLVTQRLTVFSVDASVLQNIFNMKRKTLYSTAFQGKKKSAPFNGVPIIL